MTIRQCEGHSGIQGNKIAEKTEEEQITKMKAKRNRKGSSETNQLGYRQCQEENMGQHKKGTQSSTGGQLHQILRNGGIYLQKAKAHKCKERGVKKKSVTNPFPTARKSVLVASLLITCPFAGPDSESTKRKGKGRKH